MCIVGCCSKNGNKDGKDNCKAPVLEKRLKKACEVRINKKSKQVCKSYKPFEYDIKYIEHLLPNNNLIIFFAVTLETFYIKQCKNILQKTILFFNLEVVDFLRRQNISETSLPQQCQAYLKCLMKPKN
ncbi:693_t:CDS:2 [Racocetra fulgida]|uniref:693_t:CDS:1 n=1 Tax=Racocetra fulgida TaxID=60492 RepID=A0A9N8VS19_9GLOM|nr:693_t:CDS:2 [Racocetra fulgida]